MPESPMVRIVVQHPEISAAATAGILIAVGVVSWLVLRKKPSAEELERRRRELLATAGRIIDGSIIDTPGIEMVDEVPDLLVYKYQLAGVEYECAQDVSALKEQMTRVRMDLPVTIKYDPRNPGNSIVLAEGWSGLRR